MSKSAKSRSERKAGGEVQLWLRLPGQVRDALYATVIEAGLACVDEVLESRLRIFVTHELFNWDPGSAR